MDWFGSRVLHFARDRAASSAVEFALLMPVYLMLVLGALAYGIYFGATHSVQQLAADAARAAVAGLGAEERAMLADGFVATNARSYLWLDPDRLEVVPEPSPFDPGQYHVTVRYDASALPIWNIYPPLPLPSSTIAHRSTIRNGGL
ncbi:TadE/TadG family type IV pilus assembly protein [Pelagibacterium montanilacus]|uniref:TadE/TadG family type IV pilus assembly protein n=1 Tax=Pelagibacterium montanilacus TaxID=2185280 RepID=UPI000F8F7F3B|nr:TadE/TadG family type IV pilus assembly protein [Pelagibacterium montanilacus]